MMTIYRFRYIIYAGIGNTTAVDGVYFKAKNNHHMRYTNSDFSADYPDTNKYHIKDGCQPEPTNMNIDPYIETYLMADENEHRDRNYLLYNGPYADPKYELK